MPAPAPDTSHLVALIEAARAEAARLGPPASLVAGQLAEAARTAGALAGPGGTPDQGIRPDELTTDNDE